MPKTSSRLVACPQCGKKSPWNPENPWRPFCSERCKTIDLAAWANESYRVPQQGGGDEIPDSENGFGEGDERPVS
ncbi:MAG: DNA gyrase inhibitor YacG [Betaproteobacteria bacterium]|nr:DNA gyrase inhibitor YacG [Betaproteobacteria bacterium]